MNGTADIRWFGVDTVKGDGRPEIDDDQGRMETLPGGDSIDDAVSTDLRRILGGDLHAECKGIRNSERWLPKLTQVAAGKMQPAGFQSWHHRGDNETGDPVRVDAHHPEQAVVADCQLIGGSIPAGLEPPGTDQLALFINTAHGMGISNIHSKKHIVTCLNS